MNAKVLTPSSISITILKRREGKARFSKVYFGILNHLDERPKFKGGNMEFFVKSVSDGKINGPYSVEEILQRVSQKISNETDLIIEAKGQTLSELKRSDEWAPIKSLTAPRQIEANRATHAQTNVPWQGGEKNRAVEVADKFVTLQGYGKFISGFGWLVIAIGIVILAVGTSAFGLAIGVISGAIAILAGISYVAFGQIISCFVSIEKNTRNTYELLRQMNLKS